MIKMSFVFRSSNIQILGYNNEKRPSPSAYCFLLNVVLFRRESYHVMLAIINMCSLSLVYRLKHTIILLKLKIIFKWSIHFYGSHSQNLL